MHFRCQFNLQPSSHFPSSLFTFTPQPLSLFVCPRILYIAHLRYFRFSITSFFDIMFAPSNRPDAMTELQRKRAREEEEQMGNGSTGFCEHRNVRQPPQPPTTNSIANTIPHRNEFNAFHLELHRRHQITGRPPLPSRHSIPTPTRASDDPRPPRGQHLQRFPPSLSMAIPT